MTLVYRDRNDHQPPGSLKCSAEEAEDVAASPSNFFWEGGGKIG